MHIECMVMHDVQNESLVFLYQLGTLSPLPSGEKEVSQTPHSAKQIRKDLIACKKDLLRHGSNAKASDVTTEDPHISRSIEFNYDYASELVPLSLYNHLAWLITDIPTEMDESGRVKLSLENHEKVLNLAQDIAHNDTK